MWKAGKLCRFLLVPRTASQWTEYTVIRALSRRMSLLQPLPICAIPYAFRTLAVLPQSIIRTGLFPRLSLSHHLISLILLD